MNKGPFTVTNITTLFMVNQPLCTPGIMVLGLENFLGGQSVLTTLAFGGWWAAGQ